MTPLIASLLSATIISAISLVGVVFLLIQKKRLKKILLLLVGFSAGAMMGGAFLHLIPEAIEESSWNIVGVAILIGFGVFFIIERILMWHHCHEQEGECDVHTFAYTNLIGDGVHNFIDGMVIAVSFSVDFNLGIATSIAIVLHELPQEISDFGVLIYAGFSRLKALLFNLASAALAIVGALVGYFLSGRVENLMSWLLPLAAGGFIYIAASDLIPELHKEKNLKKTILSFILFILGVAFMWGMKVLFE
jgi:zinc and cadmium transporter